MKIKVIFIITIILFLLTGCSQNTNKTSEEVIDVMNITDDNQDEKITYSIESDGLSYFIESNEFTPFTVNGNGTFFKYTFEDNNEILVYLQRKQNLISLNELKRNYSDITWTTKNDIKIFKTLELNDGVLFVLSYLESSTPDIIEIWKEDNESVINIYYISYNKPIDESAIKKIKNFCTYIKNNNS